MLLENVQVLSLPDLIDLLVRTSAQMQNLMRRKETNIAVIRDMRKDVQLIQSEIIQHVIELRGLQKLRKSLLFRHLLTHQEN